VALRPAGFPEVCNAWVGQAPGVQSFFTPDPLGVLQPLRQQEAVGGNAQTGVMMKPAPPRPSYCPRPRSWLRS
jgi:hypothetical protein